jgi:NAD(P)-dependent dehydrogenase (short-subunit alcohol dehydrogenase family)
MDEPFHKRLNEHVMAKNGNGSIAGKVAFVTGGASGIGRAGAAAFAREAASVVVADARGPLARTTKEAGDHSWGSCLGIRIDRRARSFSMRLEYDSYLNDAFMQFVP